MSAILEIPEVRRRVSPISVEEYHRIAVYRKPVAGAYRQKRVIEGDALLACESVPRIKSQLGRLFE